MSRGFQKKIKKFFLEFVPISLDNHYKMLYYYDSEINITYGSCQKMLNIKHYRQLKRMPRRELAEKLKVKLVTVYMWETGRRMPSVTTLAEIARVLGCDINDLIKRDGMSNEKEKDF